MKFNLELEITEAKALFESGVMEKLDEVVRNLNEGTEEAKPVQKAKAKEVKYEEPKEEVKTASKEETKTDLTIEDIRAKFTELNSKSNRPKLKAILDAYGVRKVTDLEEKDFESVIEDLEKI